jgi:hypothetical protein
MQQIELELFAVAIRNFNRHNIIGREKKPEPAENSQVER